MRAAPADESHGFNQAWALRLRRMQQFWESLTSELPRLLVVKAVREVHKRAVRHLSISEKLRVVESSGNQSRDGPQVGGPTTFEYVLAHMLRTQGAVIAQDGKFKKLQGEHCDEVCFSIAVMLGIGTPRLFAIDKTQPHLLGATYGAWADWKWKDQWELHLRDGRLTEETKRLCIAAHHTADLCFNDRSSPLGLAEKAQKLSQCQIDIRQQFLEARTSCAHVDPSGRKAFTTSNWQRINPCLRCRATYAAMTLIRERSGTFTEGDKDVVKSRACSYAESILL
ncbi:hypothetical protein Slin14017_G128830 [Septoria linicola]|nr:hypothetical protein Slin14017_G128830 [Septoria linicola]